MTLMNVQHSSLEGSVKYLSAYLAATWAALESAPSTDLAPALQHLIEMMSQAPADQRPLWAVGCGALVERGANPLTAFEAVLSHFIECAEQTIPDEQHVSLLTSALLSIMARSSEVRQRASTNNQFMALARTLGLDNLISLARMLENEEILVFYPEQERGYRITIDGILDNARLHVLLANALIGDSEEGRLPGLRPDPRSVAAAGSDSWDISMPLVRRSFDFLDWRGLCNDKIFKSRRDLTKRGYWIKPNQIPADLPRFEDQRVLMLRPASYQELWFGKRPFESVNGSLRIVEVLPLADVRSWIYRMTDALAEQEIHDDPDGAVPYETRGCARHRHGDLDGAFADYNEALKRNSDLYCALSNRAMIYRIRGDAANAIKDSTEALRLKPDNAFCYYCRGLAHTMNGDEEKAIADHTMAIRYAPSDPDYYFCRASAQGRSGNHVAAIEDYTAVLQFQPKNGTAYINRGIEYAWLNDFENAMTDINQAILIDPTVANGYLNRGYVYGRMNRLDEALTDYAEAIRLDPHFKLAYMNRAITLRQQARYQEALETCNAVLQFDPQHFPVYHNRGLIRAEMQEFEAALADFDAALRLSPANNEVRLERCRVYQQQKDYDRLIAATTDILSDAPTYLGALFLRGYAYIEKGDYPLAIADYDTLLGLNPADGIAYNNRAYVYLKLENYAQALADGNEAVRLQPDKSFCYYTRGMARGEGGDWAGGIDDLNKALALDPTHEDVEKMKAKIVEWEAKMHTTTGSENS